jgi:hypothetical protein
MKSFLFRNFLLVSVLALAIGMGGATGFAPMAMATEPVVGEITLDREKGAETTGQERAYTSPIWFTQEG